MEEKELDEFKEETIVDNSCLEELIKQDITPQMQREVFKVLKKSRLFLPVDFGPDAFNGIENTEPGDKIEGPKGFNILFLTDSEGKRAVPLFTSEEIMKEAGVRTSVMVMYMSDLAGMLTQTDKYSIISINPFTEHDLNMPVEAFLAQFRDEIEDNGNEQIRKLLQRKDLSEDELKILNEKLLSSMMIVGCVDVDGGTNFVLIGNNENKLYLPLFTDIDEFKKVFYDYREDIYPQVYNFADLVNDANEDLVINPASESFELSPEIFK